MSGRRRAGSSAGSGLPVPTVDLLPAMATTFFASSSTVNSSGLPRFTGPVKSSDAFIMRIRPSIMSST